MNRLVSILLALLICGIASGASQRRVADPNNDAKVIAEQLGSNSPEQVKAGIQAIRELFQQQPARALSGFRNGWCKQLLDGKQYAALDELAEVAMLAQPSEPWLIDQMMQQRVRAALNDGKPQQAMVLAKQYYNACQMGNTGGAMALVAECLNTPPVPANARMAQFRDEQLAGAATQSYGKDSTAIYSAKPAVTSPTLAAIQVDGRQYIEKARSITAEDYAALTARANLYLLADRPADALLYAERAYSMAAEGALPQATDTIARCMKAADGTIGRANAWLLSIRPKAAK